MGEVMKWIKEVNEFFSNFDSIIGMLGFLGMVIGSVVGFLGKKELQEATKLKVQIEKMEAKIEKIEVTNSQIATTINNHGLSYKDTKDIATEVVIENTKNKPNVICSQEEPEGLEVGDYWVKPY